MLPEWLTGEDNYVPPKKGGTFITKTIKSIGAAMARIRVQKGHEKGHPMPAIVKLLLLFVLVLSVSVSHNRLFLLAVFAAVQLYLCFWPARDILFIYKSSMFAAIIALIIVLPAMIIKPDGAFNNIILVLKVFLSVSMVNIFNHTTSWNHITGALRKLHIPGLFVFTLDITVKNIILLGQIITDMLTAMKLRAVGKNKKEYDSIGGVMGTTFLRSVKMSEEMYEAMRCRGFTDDYKGL